MLIRQKTILSLLNYARKPLSPTVFVKLMFLLRKETALYMHGAFYDFLPYHYGPFSFALYHELGHLRHNGYLAPGENPIHLARGMFSNIEEVIQQLPDTIRQAVKNIIDRYARLSQSALIAHVYGQYPWYAANSRLVNYKPTNFHKPKRAELAVYTTGYQGKSVDSFFNMVLQRGIHRIIDVRANPVSRKYGFSLRRLDEISKNLELDYYHVPSVGIPSSYRAGLDGYETYQRLFSIYEKKMLTAVQGDIKEVGELMRQRPSVLVCFEEDIRYCHRSPLAEAVSRSCGLQVIHL
jgi:uncharacterized protein (DUF488 family)